METKAIPQMPHGARLAVGRRDTRWDVYPQQEQEELIAHNYDGFWALLPDRSAWFKTPTSYVIQRLVDNA